MDILIRGLEPGSNYILQARAKGSNGATSQWSTTYKLLTTSDVNAPNPVTSLTWVPNGTAFVATWIRPTTDSTGLPLKDFHSYQVTLSANSISKTYVVLQERFDLSFEQNVALFGTPQPAVEISIKVRDTVGNLSTPVTATATNPIPADITGLTAEGIFNAISLVWDATSEDDFKEYEVYMSTSGPTFTPGPANLIAKTTTPSFLLPTTNSTEHYFKVRQVDVFNQPSAGFATAQAAPILSTGLDTTPPDAPTNVVATTNPAIDGSSSIHVAWDAVTSENLSEYSVRYSTDEVDWRYVVVPADQTNATIENLLPSTNYYVAVASVSRVNSYSAFVAAAPYPINSAADTTAPSQPETPTVSVSNTSANKAQISHTLNKATGGDLEADTSYLEVHASTASDFTPTTSTLVGTIEVASTAVAVSGVFYYPTTADIANLYWKVIAVDLAGNKSPASPQATGVPGLILNANIADATITSAKINSLEANKITAGSGIINDLSIKSKLTIDDIDGFIQSGNYDGTAKTGWRLDQSGLTIFNGTISAAALLLQDSENIAPVMFSDFEFTPEYYYDSTGAFNPNHLWTSSGMVLAQNTDAKTGNFSMRLSNGSVASGSHHSIVFSSGGFVTNAGSWINVAPGDYILSFWAKKNGSVNQFIGPALYTENNTYLAPGTVDITSTSWTRYSVVVTVPSGVSRVKMYMDIGPMASNTGYDVLLDTIQVERKMTAETAPSPWKPPSMTSIDGGSIVTGSIRSSAPAAGVSNQPAWSLNTTGGMQVGDALVRGTLTIGAGADTTNSVAKSANYVTNVSGWVIRGDGTAEFNSTIVRGSLTVSGANGSMVTSLQGNYPTLYFYNANNSNSAYLNLVDATGANANLGIHSGQYASSLDGVTQIRARLWMMDPTGVSHLGWVRQDNQNFIGGHVNYTDSYVLLTAYDLNSYLRGRIFLDYNGLVQIDSRDLNNNVVSRLQMQNNNQVFLTSNFPNANDPTAKVGELSMANASIFLGTRVNLSTTIAQLSIDNTDGSINFLGGNSTSNAGRRLKIGGDGTSWLKVNLEGWNNITYTNGWTTRAGFFPLGYKLMPDGTVRLRGTCSPGGINTSPGVIPVGYRPSSTVSFPVTHDGAGSGQVVRVNIGTDGVLTVNGMATLGSTMGFDHVTYSIY